MPSEIQTGPLPKIVNVGTSSKYSSESERNVEGFYVEVGTKLKGCDIGYALAADSCEGANSVDACTVTAFDAITAFAVPNPNWSSQTWSVFSGPDARLVTLPS